MPRRLRSMSSNIGASRFSRPRRALAAAALVAVFACPSTGSADWLVTREGERMETLGPWQVDGNSVVFARLDGSLASLPLREIDLRRSRLLSGKGEDRQDDSSLSDLQSGDMTLARRAAEDSSTGTTLDAREEWGESRRSRDRVEARVKVGSLKFDNYFQAPEDEPEEEVQATSADLRLMWRLGTTSLLKSYVQLQRVEYETLPATSAYALGFRLDGERHYLDLFSRKETNRGALDIGDDFEEAEILRHHVGYSLRFARTWEWSLEADFRDQDFDVSTERDTELFETETALRYRGFGRSFSPEIGMRWGARDAVNDDYDYTENDLYLKLRFSPVRIFAFSVRVRDRSRDYDVRDPTARTFGRKDSRRQWTVSADLLLRRNLAFTLYYDNVDGDSSDPGRIFATQMLAGYMTFKAGKTTGLRSPGTKEPPRLSPPHREKLEADEAPGVAEEIVEPEDFGESESAAEDLVAGQSNDLGEKARERASASTAGVETPTGQEEAKLTRGSEDAPVATEVARELLASRSHVGAAVHSVEPAAEKEMQVQGEIDGPTSALSGLVAFVDAWADSWRDQRVDDYLAFYSPSFEPADGMSRASWEEHRRTRVSTPTFIRLTLGRLSVDLAEDMASVTFRQSYRSDGFSSVVTKILELEREGGAWRIVREFARP